MTQVREVPALGPSKYDSFVGRDHDFSKNVYHRILFFRHRDQDSPRVDRDTRLFLAQHAVRMHTIGGPRSSLGQVWENIFFVFLEFKIV